MQGIDSKKRRFFVVRFLQKSSTDIILHCMTKCKVFRTAPFWGLFASLMIDVHLFPSVFHVETDPTIM